MKILITTGIYPPSIGGPATYSKLLFDELPKRGVEVEVLSYDEVRKYPRGLSHIIFLLKVLVRVRKFDLVYTQDPVSVGYPTMVACRIVRKKYILKVVGDFAWEQGVRRFGVKETLDEFVSGEFEYKDDVARLKDVEKKVAQNASQIIVPSNYLKGIVSKWGIDEEKIKVIYNAYSETKASGSKEELRKDFGWNSPTLISVGRLVPWKGFGGLIETVSGLINKFPELKLKIVGSGPQKDELQKVITENKLDGHIELVGALPKEELSDYINASDVFVLNTNYEGLSHQLLEVLALETPIVTTNVGGNPEVIEDGVNGVLVPYNDKESLGREIERMILDPEKSENLTKEGVKTLSKFDRGNMLKKLVDTLKNG